MMAPRDLATIVLFHAFRAMPLSLVSGAGAAIGHLFAYYAYLQSHLWFKRTVANMSRLAGVDDREARRRVFSLLRQSGRVTAEFSISDRCTERLTTIGAEQIRNRSNPDRPVVVVSLHLANWEAAGAPLGLNGIPVTALYDPPRNPIVHQLALKSRERLIEKAPGCKLVAASSTAVRELIQAARSGENILIYVDEEKGGNVLNPPFGRRLSPSGNGLLAAHLALRYGMDILPIHVRRTRGVNFQVIIEPPIETAGREHNEDEAKRLSQQISTRIETAIRGNLSQWYWLPNLRLGDLISGEPTAAGPAPPSRVEGEAV